MLVAIAWLDVLGTERMQSGRQAWAVYLCILCATVTSNGMDRKTCGLPMHSLIGEQDMTPLTQEAMRLQQAQERTAHWRRWGPYLSERAWGTVREDYSPYGSAWDFFSHDQARSRAFRWNEDGIAGICD